MSHQSPTSKNDDNTTAPTTAIRTTPTTAKLLSQAESAPRLTHLRSLVAQPLEKNNRTQTFLNNDHDNTPARLSGHIYIGNHHHAANIPLLKQLQITAVLNCASGGISQLPVNSLNDNDIAYHFTNVRQDDCQYPILHHPRTGMPSNHLQVARALYESLVHEPQQQQQQKPVGNLLFFCVAGMNRSPTLALAVLMLFGYKLDTLLQECHAQRPFVLENVGFQWQLVQLEDLLLQQEQQKYAFELPSGRRVYTHAARMAGVANKRSKVREHSSNQKEEEEEEEVVEIELLLPGWCTMEVNIPKVCTVHTVKDCLVRQTNTHLLPSTTSIAKSWLVLAMFGYHSMYDVPLEEEVLDETIVLDRIVNMFSLSVDRESGRIQWNSKCRFALVIFSVWETNTSDNDTTALQRPWTFFHQERAGAPATFLENNLMSTHLRGWDFETGQAFASAMPIVFSYSHDTNDKRGFMRLSTSANVPQQFHAPGEGNILGMGANAIVHRVQLKPASLSSPHKGHPEHGDPRDQDEELSSQDGWDAAVKRPFTLSKMLAFLGHSNEAGLAKRMRFANSLNSDGRVLFFYGLGVAMSANAADIEPDHGSDANYSKVEYRWEAILLSRYEEEFASYTMKRFMNDYVSLEKSEDSASLQNKFSIIDVKILLVSLLNAFRDLTLMGIQAFDFNHLNNVLVSRDHRTVRLIDIDGNSQGSIQYPPKPAPLRKIDRKESWVHKPSLYVDLNAVLPTVVEQLLLGKGRGVSFVSNKRSEIWHAPPKAAKTMICNILMVNFYEGIDTEQDRTRANDHVSKVAEWFYAVLKKGPPWNNWTKDIYDAMRCIDHLPIN